MNKHVKIIKRQEEPLVLNIKGKAAISATPAHVYHPLEVLRESGCEVIKVTSDDVDAPIFLIEEPAAGSDLSKAAQVMGTMQHVSIISGGHAAEIVWHAAEKAPAEKAPAEKAPAEKAPAKKAPVKKAPAKGDAA